MPSSVPKAFLRHIQRHNREVLWLTFFSTIAAVVVWGGLFALAQMVMLLGVTVVHGVNAKPIPYFEWWFIGGGLILCVVRAATRHWLRPERFRVSRHYFLWVLSELLFFPPNLILAIPGNLFAWVHLRTPEVEAAWELLHSLHGKKKVFLSMVPQLIPDAALREKAFLTLQICGLMYPVPVASDWLLQLKNEEAAKLAAGSFKFG